MVDTAVSMVLSTAFACCGQIIIQRIQEMHFVLSIASTLSLSIAPAGHFAAHKPHRLQASPVSSCISTPAAFLYGRIPGIDSPCAVSPDFCDTLCRKPWNAAPVRRDGDYYRIVRAKPDFLKFHPDICQIYGLYQFATSSSTTFTVPPVGLKIKLEYCICNAPFLCHQICRRPLSSAPSPNSCSVTVCPAFITRNCSSHRPETSFSKTRLLPAT